MRKYVSIGALVILGVLFVWNGFVFEKKLSVSSFLGNLVDIDSIDVAELKTRIGTLEKENERLKAELLGEGDDAINSIKVYSSHPFNSRSEIAIAAGGDKGISVGDTAVYAGTVLVGRVKSVFESSSIVTTIFDPSWEMAVRIGNAEVDALLKGGNELKIYLIPHDTLIEEGDAVVSADKSFPYGLELGYVKQIGNTEGDVFKEAVLEPVLQLKNIRNVGIYR